jgi:hypothetical protein
MADITTLDGLVTMVLDIKLREADPDDTLAYLHLADCAYDNDGKPMKPRGMIIAALAVGPGFVMAPVARLMIATCEPSCAALALPSWHAKMPPGQDLKTYGVSQVKDLPADMVQDSLVVIGEDEAGTSVLRMYVIERDASGKRVWVKQPTPDGWSSRFNHLFVLPEMLKTAMPFASQFGLSPDKARYHGKRAALRILAEQAEKAFARNKST